MLESCRIPVPNASRILDIILPSLSGHYSYRPELVMVAIVAAFSGDWVPFAVVSDSGRVDLTSSVTGFTADDVSLNSSTECKGPVLLCRGISGTVPKLLNVLELAPP
jgi:hypothetical protein